MLEIRDLTIKTDEETLCQDQNIKVCGLCGVLGQRNILRECFISELSTSISKHVPGMISFKYIYFNNKVLSNYEFQKSLNQYTVFNSLDTVEDILYFINVGLADQVIKDFKLENNRKTLVSELLPQHSSVFEIAVAVCSQANIQFCSEILDPYQPSKYYYKMIRKYIDLKQKIIFIETDIYDKAKFDSYLFIGDDFFDSYIFENKLTFDNWLYENMTLQRKNIKLFEKNQNISKKLKKSDKKSIFFYFYKMICFLHLDFSKAIILTNSKLNRQNESKFSQIFYQTSGNFTLILLFIKHFFSLHLLFLYLLKNLLFCSITFHRSSFEIFTVIKYNFKRCKYDVIFRFFQIYLYNFIDKYIQRYNLPYDFFKNFKIEYFSQTPLFVYKFASSFVYFFIFYRSSSIITKDTLFIKRYLHISFSPCTYYFHLILYTFIGSALPMFIISILLNIRHLYLFVMNAIFLIPFFNLFSSIKGKIIIISYIVTFNLVYPIMDPNYRKSFFTLAIEKYEPFNLCRNAYYEDMNFLLLCKLCCIWTIVWLVYCLMLPFLSVRFL